MKVYTAIFGDFDRVEPVTYLSEEASSVEHICFSDRPMKASDWNVIVREPPIEGTIRMKAKWFKVNSHLLFGDENSLYIDGNYRLTKDPRYLEDYITRGPDHRSSDLVLFRHYRNYLRQEFKVCLRRMSRDKSLCADIKRQRDAYEKCHDLDNLSVYHGSSLFRGPKAKEFNELWWEHINEYSKRDQLSLAVVAHVTRLNYSVFPGPALDSSCLITKAFTHNEYKRNTRELFS